MAQALPEDVEGISNYLRTLQALEQGDDIPEPRQSTPQARQKKAAAPQPQEKMVRIYDDYGSWTEVPESVIGTGPMSYTEDDIALLPLEPPAEPQPGAMNTYNDPYANEYISDQSANVVPVQQVVQKRMDGKEWSLKETVSEKYNSVKTYSICSNYSGKPILDDIMMYESAATILNLMNSGKVLSDPKVLGIIASGIQYGTVIKEGITHAERRQKALSSRDYNTAMQIDEDIEKTKKDATALREHVLKYLRDEGYIE